MFNEHYYMQNIISQKMYIFPRELYSIFQIFIETYILINCAKVGQILLPRNHVNPFVINDKSSLTIR